MSFLSSFHLLPDDFHKEVAHQLMNFFHSFYRFGTSNYNFDINDPSYVQFLSNIIQVSMAIGCLTFIVICCIIVRRCFLHYQTSVAKHPQYTRSALLGIGSLEMSAVMILVVIATSSWSGLLGEAQLDYSVGVVSNAVTNTTQFFQATRSSANDSIVTSGDIRTIADRMIVSSNLTDLPQEAFKLSIEALRLIHSSKLVMSKALMLPVNISEIADNWQDSYFVLKSTTYTAIFLVGLSSVLSIAAIGWSMVTPLRLSGLLLLSAIPVSHTLIGVYLSSTLMTADFCAAPMNSTMQLYEMNPIMEKYIRCPMNQTNIFETTLDDLKGTALTTAGLHQKLVEYAKSHGDTGRQMEETYLIPIGKHLLHLNQALVSLEASKYCHNVSNDHSIAVTAYCEYGMLGFVSMWVHQLLLCLFLFVAIITVVLVYERVYIRQQELERTYAMVATVDYDCNGEHIYIEQE